MLEWAASFVSLRGGIVVLASAVVLSGCHDAASSEYVADQFADAYFRRFDQEAAMAQTALGATEMLDKELKDTKSIRESYSPAEAAASVTFTHGPPTPRDARVDYHYVITARADDDSPPVIREADIELAKIAGAWKVVTVHFVQ
jgi:outer membrane PBP1 activator LpoA protein